MKKKFKKYVWLFEWIAAAIVIAVGCIIGLVDGIVLMATGVVLIILALLRVIPLFKTMEDTLMKWINAIEILINAAIGVVMIVMTVNSWNNNETIELGHIFGYLLGSVLYVRAVVFFLGTSLRGEHTDVGKFIAHILFITLGTFFILRPTDEKAIGYFVMAIAILCAIYIIIDGALNYNNYRHEYASELEIKKIQKKEKEHQKEEKRKSKTDVIEEPVIETPIGDVHIDITIEEPRKEEDSEVTDQPSA